MPISEPANNVEIYEILSNTLFTNNTGRFHPRSHGGNQYIMVAFHACSNVILVQPFANKADVHQIPVYKALYARQARANNAPTMHV